MKYRYEFSITGLWTIAIGTTLWLTRGTDLFSYLGPLFLICMTGSIIIVRQARCSKKHSHSVNGDA